MRSTPRPRSSERPRRTRLRLIVSRSRSRSRRRCHRHPWPRHQDRRRSNLRPRHLPPSKRPITADVNSSSRACIIRGSRGEGSRGRGVADWGWKGRVSGCVEAITEKHRGVIVGIVARPTEYRVRAGIAEETTVFGRPTREEIVTVTTCEHGGELVHRAHGRDRDEVSWRESLRIP